MWERFKYCGLTIWNLFKTNLISCYICVKSKQNRFNFYENCEHLKLFILWKYLVEVMIVMLANVKISKTVASVLNYISYLIYTAKFLKKTKPNIKIGHVQIKRSIISKYANLQNIIYLNISVHSLITHISLVIFISTIHIFLAGITFFMN